MTLADLIAEAERGERDALLTLREASEVSGIPHATIKKWVYRTPIIPVVLWGPKLRPRIRASVILRICCSRTPSGRIVASAHAKM